MLRIAVELPAELTTPGEFLADVQAYEVAGVDAIRFGGGPLEPLTLLGAAAAVTSHVRLAASLTGPGRWPAALLAHVLGTLERMSRGRAMLDLEVGPASAEVEELIGALRSAGATPPILVAGAQEAALRCAARLGDGLVCDLAAAGSAFARVRELRPKPDEREPDEREPDEREPDEREPDEREPDEREPGIQRADAFELWARARAPSGRAEWRDLLTAAAELGATGLIVAHAPNLLDILRNPEEDDRQDLAMAVG